MGFVRRSGRIAKEIRIMLIGSDSLGRAFAEETRTLTLSRHGAGLVSRHKLAADGALTLKFLGGSTEASIRLVGQLGEDARGFVYGVAFVDDDLDFWELNFPPAPVWQVDFTAPLQCISCQTREVVDQSEVEADVYALAESILRFCQTCGTATQWRQAAREPAFPQRGSPGQPGGLSEYDLLQPESPEQKAAARPRLVGIEIAVPEEFPPAALSPAATTALARTANRRRDVRTRVSFTACVRHEDTEEIVECGNISKGGFSFRSRNAYPVGTAIDVSLPYYPGTQAVFVAASIRHSLALPSHNFYYGAMYARVKKPRPYL